MPRRSPAPPSSGPPVVLLRFELDEWADADDSGAFMQRKIRGYQRWMAARRAWCAGRGLNFVDVFRPEWRQGGGSANPGSPTSASR